jgi:MFS family permease
MLATLRHRDFTLVWLAGLISMLGDRAMLIALQYYVYVQTGSTLAMAVMFTAFYAPMLLFGSVAGVFVDRWSRKRVMVVTNLAQGSAILALLLAHGAAATWIPYVVVFITMSMEAFFAPAEAAIIPSLVPEDNLVSANGLNALIDNIARLAGPPIGGILIAWLGLGSVAVVDSVTFVGAAILIVFVRAPGRTETLDEAAAGAASTWVETWRDWREGLAVLGTNRGIAAVVLVAVITSFGGTMFDPLIAPWVRSVVHGNATVLGSISTAGALGGMLGGILLGQFGRGIAPNRLFAAGCILTAGLLGVMYSVTILPVIIALSFVKSVPLVGSGAGLQTLLQTRVPDQYRGRIYGALGTSNAMVGVAGVWLAGALAGIIGIVHMLDVACLIMAVAGALGMVLLGDRPSTVRAANGGAAAQAAD